MVEGFVTWLLGAALIASAAMCVSFGARLWRAAAEREGWTPYIQLLAAILFQSAGVLLGSIGRLIDALLMVAAGLILIVTSRQMMLWPETRFGRWVFAAQLAALMLWTAAVAGGAW